MGLLDKIRQKVSSVVSTATEVVSSVASEAIEILKFDRLKEGLTKTRDNLMNRLGSLLASGRKIDESLLEDIEEILITADIGVKTATLIIDSMRARVRKEGFENSAVLYDIIKEEILRILAKSASANFDHEFTIPEEKKPFVMLVIGVNGVGKTTSIGKLALNYKEAGHNVLIGAADTFRAAANEQLEVWAQRADVEIIQQHQGADPAAVAFDTIKAAIARKSDVVIIDTAGRLHNKAGLMAELEKISRVMKKLKASAPDEVFLVLDATTGQNAIQQAKEFTKVAPITGLILTKLDGTAKGGVVIAIANELNLPVRYIGVGEKINDLQVFDPAAFVEALFEKS